MSIERRRGGRGATKHGHDHRHASSVTTTTPNITPECSVRDGAASDSDSTAARPRYRRHPTTPLLENMMRWHTHSPHDDYAVLSTIGEGSMGCVERVVRRHRRHPTHPRKTEEDGDERMRESERSDDVPCLGGIFAKCCSDGRPDRKRERVEKGGMPPSRNSIWATLSSMFGGRGDALVDPADGDRTPPIGTPVTTSRSSAASEATVFSEPGAVPAPPTARDVHGESEHNTGAPSPRRGAQHAPRQYALKSIRLDRTSFKKSDESELRNEISVLRSLDHPNVVHVIDAYDAGSTVYVVLDLCEGGDLYARDPYTECEARAIARQLLGAVGYMHSRGIVHRDLKYENVMFDGCARDRGGGRGGLEVKVIDFGLSVKYARRGRGGMDDPMSEFVGTVSSKMYLILQPIRSAKSASCLLSVLLLPCTFVSLLPGKVKSHPWHTNLWQIYTMAPEVIRGSYN